MKRTLSLLAIGMLGACAAAAQTGASAQAGASVQSESPMQTNKPGTQVSGSGSAAASATASAAGDSENNSLGLASGTKIDATLATSLDAKRSKIGDDVEVRTEEDIKQDGKVVLKKGAHLVGHVTTAQARVNGQTQSQLGIAFDHVVLKYGQEVPFNATILAVAAAKPPVAPLPPPASSDNLMTASAGSGMAQGGMRGGLISGVATDARATTGTMTNAAASVPSAGGATLNNVSRSSGAVGGLNAAGRLSFNSSGVFGLEGLALNSADSSAAQGSVLISATRNVHLDSGTQLLLQTSAQGQ